MIEEQLKAFLEKVKGDTSLQEKLNAEVSPEAAIEIAKAASFSITAEDIQSMQSAEPLELSDEVLEGTAEVAFAGAGLVNEDSLEATVQAFKSWLALPFSERREVRKTIQAFVRQPLKFIYSSEFASFLDKTLSSQRYKYH